MHILCHKVRSLSPSYSSMNSIILKKDLLNSCFNGNKVIYHSAIHRQCFILYFVRLLFSPITCDHTDFKSVEPGEQSEQSNRTEHLFHRPKKCRRVKQSSPMPKYISRKSISPVVSPSKRRITFGSIDRPLFNHAKTWSLSAPVNSLGFESKSGITKSSIPKIHA